MLNLLPWICALPLAAFVVLTIGRERLPAPIVAALGVGSIGAAALGTLLVGWDFLTHPPEGGVFTYRLWTWMKVGTFAPTFALELDALSLTMLGVITGVGFLIHLFAAWYMRGDPGYARFFSYMNLFVASMLFLVLGSDLLFLYFGWEGVGLCSYLLIGFWYEDPANGLAARKAFVITRIGDTALIIGLFLLYREFGTLDIDTIARLAPSTWAVGSTLATTTCLLLLGGAVGKSAQLPLQTWLPDAMAGPTPVSALIHAATMVTAGVYLIARFNPLFALSPFALEAVGIVGAATLLLAGCAALVQTDIKRVLAYSTMSQIGYMFLAEGVGAYEPAMFHLMTHAFFKALLFLAAGSVILHLDHEQDIFKMGGLRKSMPLAFACMLVGTLALAAVPFTAGYYSKDAILALAYETGHGDLWLAGVVGAFLTALYGFRLVFIVFFGDARAHAVGAGLPAMSSHAPAAGMSHHVPLVVLLVLSLAGALIHPPLAAAVPHPATAREIGALEYLPALVSFAGIALAWFFFVQSPRSSAALAASPATGWIARWWKNAWGFDALYAFVFERPFVALSRATRNDPIDRTVDWTTALVASLGRLASATQTGRLRYYAAIAGLGVTVLIALMALR